MFCTEYNHQGCCLLCMKGCDIGHDQNILHTNAIIHKLHEIALILPQQKVTNSQNKLTINSKALIATAASVKNRALSYGLRFFCLGEALGTNDSVGCASEAMDEEASEKVAIDIVGGKEVISSYVFLTILAQHLVS